MTKLSGKNIYKDMFLPNLLKVPEIFALKMSVAADKKLHFLIVEILLMWSITCTGKN